MKRIDFLLIKSFIPPFLLAFLIALFVLVMQTMFIYLDDFVGKELGLFVMLEMIFYLSIKLFPMALAIGVLLASVMVFGNMGEKYELSSFKSAGVSLFRIMRSLIVLVTFISIFSYLCNDYLNPKANLQFHSRMWDIRRQKPTMSIEEKMFNNDFFGFSIWIDEKLANDRDIEGVLVYNQSQNTNDIDVISAVDGEMYTTPSGQHFLMKLNEGVKYSEQYKEAKNGKISYPFIRTEFKSWKKAFDLNEFELTTTDQDLFKSHHYMRTSAELIVDIDSFKVGLSNVEPPMDSRFQKILDIELETDKEMEMRKTYTRPDDSPQDSDIVSNDIVEVEASEDDEIQAIIERIERSEELALQGMDAVNLDGGRGVKLPAKPSPKVTEKWDPQELFEREELISITAVATTSIKNLQYDISKAISEERRMETNLAKFKFELHSKFSLAIACLIFLFIGAPMGAIVRKGGFGYPLLISIIFFALYVIASIAMKKMAESLKIDAIFGAWLPTLVIFAIGLFLTIKAKNDSKMMDLDGMTSSFKKLASRFKKAKTLVQQNS